MNNGLMTEDEAIEYLKTLSDGEKTRFGLLANMYYKLGKPAEVSYALAKKMIDEKTEGDK